MHPNTLSTFVAFLETFAMVIEDTLINPFEHRLPADRLNLETVLVVYERAVLEFERYKIFVENRYRCAFLGTYIEMKNFIKSRFYLVKRI